jgi:hypothetical protein
MSGRGGISYSICGFLDAGSGTGPFPESRLVGGVFCKDALTVPRFHLVMCQLSVGIAPSSVLRGRTCRPCTPGTVFGPSRCSRISTLQ